MISIGVLNAKGGVGKTTFSTMLAVRAARDFARVGLVDLDPQQSAVRWRGHRGGSDDDNPLLLTGADSAADAMEGLAYTGWDVAIFDGAPGSLEETEECIRAVDFVVIPLKASDQDLASTEYVVAACKEFAKPYLLVINEATAPARSDKRAKEVHTLLTALKQPVADVIVCRRVAYVDGVNTGKSAAEIKGGKGAEAEREIDGLYVQVIALARSASKKRRSKRT
jgi:chromosome partitioning protein